MDFPKLIALDTKSGHAAAINPLLHSFVSFTSGTIWEEWLDENSWGKGSGALDPIEDSIECVDSPLLRDKTSALPRTYVMEQSMILSLQ